MRHRDVLCVLRWCRDFRDLIRLADVDDVVAGCTGVVEGVEVEFEGCGGDRIGR